MCEGQYLFCCNVRIAALQIERYTPVPQLMHAWTLYRSLALAGLGASCQADMLVWKDHPLLLSCGRLSEPNGCRFQWMLLEHLRCARNPQGIRSSNATTT